MEQKKPRKSMSTLNMTTPLCTKQIACDGDNLQMAARERGYCSKCEAAMKKKAKGPEPLRGENTALSMERRRIDSMRERARKREEGKE